MFFTDLFKPLPEFKSCASIFLRCTELSFYHAVECFCRWIFILVLNFSYQKHSLALAWTSSDVKEVGITGLTFQGGTLQG